MEDSNEGVIEIREYLDDEDPSKIVKTEMLDISKELELIQKLTKMHHANSKTTTDHKQDSAGGADGGLRDIVNKSTDNEAEFIRDLALLSESSASKEADSGEEEDILAVLEKLQSAADKRTKKSSSSTSSSQSGWKKGFLS